MYVYYGVSEVQFVLQSTLNYLATCRTCRLRSKKAILEVATSNLQKWRGFAQSWGPCMPIWHHVNCTFYTFLCMNVRVYCQLGKDLYIHFVESFPWVYIKVLSEVSCTWYKFFPYLPFKSRIRNFKRLWSSVLAVIIKTGQ